MSINADTVASLIKAFEDFEGMREVLLADVVRCLDPQKPQDKQFWRRSFVRAAFALVEGITYQLKQLALKAHEMRDGVFSESEVAYLKEELSEASLTDKGEVSVQLKRKFIPTEANLKFSFRAAANAFDSDYTLDLSGEGWRAFREALVIRHRLTHPKQHTAMQVSDGESLMIDRAFEWYRKVSLELIKSISHSVQIWVQGVAEKE